MMKLTLSTTTAIGLVVCIVLLLLGSEETSRYLKQWTFTTAAASATATKYYFQQQQQESTTTTTPQQQHHHDGCDLIDSSSSYLPQWRNYTQQETDEVDLIRQCIRTLGTIPNTTYRTQILAIRRKQQKLEESSKLDCNLKVSLQTLQDTMKQYDTVWFFGDSIMLQQFYLMVCMIDPSLGIQSGKPFNITRSTNSLHEDTSIVWHHSNNNNNDNSTGTTVIKYSHNGYIWERDEANLYERDFPTAVKTLGSNDAIILTASSHYDSTLVHLYEKAVTHIATMSTQSNASIFYMEPTPQEWPTGNGMFVYGCYRKCQCENLNPARLIGRGEYTDRTVPFDPTNKQNVPIIPILNRVYPDLAFANNTKDCYPSCLPATWRTDVGRVILADIIPNNTVSMVPVFWQLLAKGEPTSRGFNQANVGDCTHRTTEAVIVMNEQLIRTMIKRQQEQQEQRQQI